MPSANENMDASAKIEGNPWSCLSYVFFTIQFMFITLDLFMDTTPQREWHLAITTVEFIIAFYLGGYSLARLACLPKCGPSFSNKYKAVVLLSVSALIQVTILGLAGYSYAINNDPAEWSMFALSLAYGIVNPLTFGAVEARAASAKEENKKKKKQIGPVTAALNVFTRHFSRTPLLLVVSTVFAVGQALLNTYQGAVINGLTRAATKGNTTDSTVQYQSTILVLVWLSQNVARLIFDLSSAKMFTRLEIWLRDRVFSTATSPSKDSSLTAADFQARYASDVNGVVTLYATLLRGVVINILLIIANFIFLLKYRWEVATITLGFLAIGVNSGPTELAGALAAKVQDGVTEGLSLLSESSKEKSLDGSGSEGKEVDFAQKHRNEVLDPLQSHLFMRSVYANSVDAYISFFSTFLTITVVITMSWEVHQGLMDSSQFLGIFFVFKQLQKPALKISGVIKKCVAKTANLERVNALVFDNQKVSDGDLVPSAEIAPTDDDHDGGGIKADDEQGGDAKGLGVEKSHQDKKELAKTLAESIYEDALEEETKGLG